MNVLITTPPVANGVSWLVNCLLELDIICYRTSVGHMWTGGDGGDFRWAAKKAVSGDGTRRVGMALNPVEYQLQRALPIFARKKRFDFMTGLRVEWAHCYPCEFAHYDKVVLFARDPRDALYSAYRRVPGGASYAEYCGKIQPHNNLSRVEDLVLFYLMWLERQDLIIARFEDYKADAVATLNSVLERMELHFPDAQIRRAADNSTFEKAREAEESYNANNPMGASSIVKNRASRANEHLFHTKETLVADTIHAATAGLFDRMGYSFKGGASPTLEDFLPRLPRNRWFAALPVSIREKAEKLRREAAMRKNIRLGSRYRAPSALLRFPAQLRQAKTRKRSANLFRKRYSQFFTPDEVRASSENYANTCEGKLAACRKMAAADRPVYLFGCGQCGRDWAKAFGFLNFAGFIDNNAELWGKIIAGLCVHSPREIAESHPDALILGATLRREYWLAMQAQCRELGLACDLFVNHWVRDVQGPAGPAEVEADADLGKAYRLMADDLSKEIFRALARFWGTRDIAETPRCFPNQYFVEAIPTRFYRSFADVGAFDGDTLRQYTECIPWEFDNYYAIEPDPANLTRLKSAAAAIGKVEVFPVAASDKRDVLPWSSAGSSSQVSEGGAGQVECDRLDSILSGRPVTFMKMDLEGHEMEALGGAAGIIAEQRPALGICVYHRYEHLWRVPTWIDSLAPNGYRFHLRHHSWGFMRTTCYAVPL